jgi:hypothetical protein
MQLHYLVTKKCDLKNKTLHIKTNYLQAFL